MITENIGNNTYVKSVDATVDNSSGGNPLTVTLTISVVGNANRYTIDWGDGDTTTATTLAHQVIHMLTIQIHHMM